MRASEETGASERAPEIVTAFLEQVRVESESRKSIMKFEV